MQCKQYKGSFINRGVEKCDLFLNTLMSYFRKTSRHKWEAFLSITNYEPKRIYLIYGQR